VRREPSALSKSTREAASERGARLCAGAETWRGTRSAALSCRNEVEGDAASLNEVGTRRGGAACFLSEAGLRRVSLQMADTE